MNRLINEWTDASTGLTCQIRWADFCGGFPCGYVAVEEGHPWHGKEYDDINADVHGGLTFAGTMPGDERYWFGFDCGHYNSPTTEEFAQAECGRLAAQAHNA